MPISEASNSPRPRGLAALRAGGSMPQMKNANGTKPAGSANVTPKAAGLGISLNSSGPSRSGTGSGANNTNKVFSLPQFLNDVFSGGLFKDDKQESVSPKLIPTGSSRYGQGQGFVSAAENINHDGSPTTGPTTGPYVPQNTLPAPSTH